MRTFAAPRPPQYLQFNENGGKIELTILRKEEKAHESFKCKGKPAPIFRAMNHTAGDEEQRWTITSAQLIDTLELIEKDVGKLDGVRMIVVAEGKEKQRTYSIALPE